MTLTADTAGEPTRVLTALRNVLGTTIAIQALGFVSGALVARLLGVEGRGALAAVVIGPAVIANVGDLGGPVAYAFLAARHPARLNRLVGNAIATALLQSVCLIAVGIPLIHVCLRRYPEYVHVGIVLLAVFVPLNLVTRYLNAINQGAHDFGRFNAIRVCVMLVYVAGVAIVFALGADSVEALVAVVIVSNAAVAALVLVQHLALSRRRLMIDWPLARLAASYGPRAHIGNLTPVDAMQLDLAVVVILLGTVDAGLYAIALSAAMIVRAQGSALGMIALPTVAAARTAADARAAAASTFRLTLLLNVATATFIGIFAAELVPLIYGQDFADAATIVRILIVGSVAASLRQVLGDCLRGLGSPGSPTVAEIISWIVACVGLVALVPLFGVYGAAAAVGLSYSCAFGLVVALAGREGIRVRELLIPRRADVSTLLSVPKSFIRRVAAETA